MASRAKEIPELIRQAVDLSRTYLRQETVEPMKRLGRVAGFSAGGAIGFSLASIFIGVAGTALLLKAFPAGEVWNGVGYLAAGALTGAGGWLVLSRAIR